MANYVPSSEHKVPPGGLNDPALRQIVEANNRLHTITNIFDNSLNYMGDQMAVLCRSDIPEQLQRSVQGFLSRDPTIRNCWRAFLIFNEMNSRINNSIIQSKHPKSYALLKESLMALAMKWLTNDQGKQRKLRHEIIPIVMQKFIEQRALEGLLYLYQEFSSLVEWADDNTKVIESMREVIQAIELQCPHLRDILNSQVVQMCRATAGAQMLSRPCEAIVNLLLR